MSMTTWRELIAREMSDHGEAWEDVLAWTPMVLDLDREFDCGYGVVEGEPFTLWTEKRVYFPTVYDGAEGVCSVPRNPCDKPTEHVGGGGGSYDGANVTLI